MKTTKYFAGMALLIAATASGQNRPAHESAPAHPAPTALTKTYTPASVRALPGLQCKVYPAESASSAAITVFTDDDGYARFHAVRAAAGDKVQRLTLDCTDSDGNFSSYSADLTSAETFAPRPLNVANERGTDRPALKGDPLSTQARSMCRPPSLLRRVARKLRSRFARSSASRRGLAFFIALPCTRAACASAIPDGRGSGPAHTQHRISATERLPILLQFLAALRCTESALARPGRKQLRQNHEIAVRTPREVSPVLPSCGPGE